MKTNLLFLNEIAELIDLERFYCITIYGSSISFQGAFNSGLVLDIKSRFAESTSLISSNGFVEIHIPATESTCQLDITLT